MAYNRINILKRIIDIQNITIERTSHGVTQEWIYHNIIFPQYIISKTTYYAYLRCNAKAELKRLLIKKEESTRQLTLFK